MSEHIPSSIEQIREFLVFAGIPHDEVYATPESKLSLLLQRVADSETTPDDITPFEDVPAVARAILVNFSPEIV